jgi:ATP-dependent DNA ligase
MGSVRAYKPQMRHLPSFSEIPLGAVVTPKIDGEFNLILHSNSSTYIQNIWDTVDYALPCVRECREKLLAKAIGQAKLLGELYAVDRSGRMLRLPDFIHEVKAGDKGRVRLAVFDLIELNSKPVNEPYLWKLEEMQAWFSDGRVHVVPHRAATSPEALGELWNSWVEREGYEGLVAHNGAWFKVKKRATIDAVIIGINKKPLITRQEVTSIKVAVVREDGNLVEVADVASGIDHPLRKKLWDLTQYKVREDRETIYVRPAVVVEVEYAETFEAEKPVYSNQLIHISTQPYHSLRHPRLTRFRTDKRAERQDIPIEQLEASR